VILKTVTAQCFVASIRMINGLGHVPNMERLERLHLWTLENRRNGSDIIQVSQMIEG